MGSTNNSGAIRYSHSGSGFLSNRLSLGLVGSEDTLSITGNGFVGIRNNAPSSALDVTGQIRGTSSMIPLVLGNVTFSQNGDTPANATYNFFNATPGNQTGGLTINPWVDGRCLINLVGNGPHDFRSRINSTDDNIFMQVTNDGVNHRFMNVSTTLSPVPVLGSFGSDVAGYMRYYTGGIWKFLTPMDLTTRRGEMDGITSSTNTFNVVLPGNGSVSICPNGTTTSVMTISALSGYSEIETYDTLFRWRHKVDGTPQTTLAMSNFYGLLLDYVVIGTHTVTNPGIGQLKYNVTEEAIDFHDSVGWKKLTPGIVGSCQLLLTTNASAFSSGTMITSNGVITGASFTDNWIDISHTVIGGTYPSYIGWYQVRQFDEAVVKPIVLITNPLSSTVYRCIAGNFSNLFFDMMGPSAEVVIEVMLMRTSY